MSWERGWISGMTMEEGWGGVDWEGEGGKLNIEREHFGK